MKNSRIRFCGREGMHALTAADTRASTGTREGTARVSPKTRSSGGSAPGIDSTEMARTRSSAPKRRRAAIALLCLAAGVALGCQGSALTGAKLYLQQGE